MCLKLFRSALFWGEKATAGTSPPTGPHERLPWSDGPPGTTPTTTNGPPIALVLLSGPSAPTAACWRPLSSSLPGDSSPTPSTPLAQLRGDLREFEWPSSAALRRRRRKLDELLASLRVPTPRRVRRLELSLMMGLLPTTPRLGDIWQSASSGVLPAHQEPAPAATGSITHTGEKAISWKTPRARLRLAEGAAGGGARRGSSGGCESRTSAGAATGGAAKHGAVPDSGAEAEEDSGIDTYRRRASCADWTPRRGGGPSVETMTYRTEFALLAPHGLSGGGIRGA
ncbi:hypothetical protein TYRP_015943 [Tyrophagus putrescentiae]|nr:hypothetical protein TYRP_015943 [Tyrophagus putrescentiae]